MKKNIFNVIVGGAVSLCMSACGAGNTIDYSKSSDREIMDEGFKLLIDGDNISAAQAFEQVDYNHPYSIVLPNSWYLAGFAYYRAKKYTEAVEMFSKLLKFQPNHPKAPYAMYMIAMSYYDQMSPITREQRMTSKALDAMQNLVEKYPNSEYSKDVKPKIIIAKNNLAAKEMYIAKNLLKKKNVIAALNRYQTVIKKYETSLFVPEALFRTVEIYSIIEEFDAAKNMLKLLEVNYPDTEWFKLAKKVIAENEKPLD